MAEAELITTVENKQITTAYYDPEPILATGADIILSFGGKNIGKSTGFLQAFTKRCWEAKQRTEFVITRRYEDEFVGNRAKNYFREIAHRGWIKELTGGEWEDVTYYQGSWFLSKWDSKKYKMIKDREPFAWKRSVSAVQSDNGSQLPEAHYLFFDEFISDKAELPGEFEDFMKLYSNVRRDKEHFQAVLAGNTVNRFSCYFDGFGIDIDSIEQGKIYTYTVKNNGQKLKIAVEWCADKVEQGSREVISVLAATNEKLRMIIDGEWEIGRYPRIKKFLPKERIFTFYIRFHSYTFVCDVLQKEEGMSLGIRKFTRDLPEDCYLYTDEIDESFKHLHALGNDKISILFKQLYNMRKVFYDSNTTGNTIDAWLRSVT